MGIHHKENVSLYFAPLNQIRKSEDSLLIWQKIMNSQDKIMEAGLKAGAFISSAMRFKATHCMADAGSVVITPDGSLYPCDHCPSDACFGNVYSGVTSPDAKKEFCRTDIVREKCRKCPLLLQCTSFSHCPIEDYHCQDVIEMAMIYVLKQFVGSKEEDKDEGNSIC